MGPQQDIDDSIFDQAVRQGREAGTEELLLEAERLGRDPRFATLSDDEVERQLGTQAATITAATARYLELLAELIVRGTWGDHGARTPAQWLSWRLAVAPSTAREHVRVALRLRTLPQVAERMAAGTLSYSKARAICRLAGGPDDQEVLLSWADHGTAAHLERIASATRSTQRRLREELEPGETSRHRWRVQPHHDGTATLTLTGPVEDVLAIDDAVRRLIDVADAAEARDAAEAADVTEAADAAAAAAASHVRDAAPTSDAAEAPCAEPRRSSVSAQDRLEVLTGAVLAAADAGTPVDTSGLDAHTLVLQVAANDLADPSPSSSAVPDEASSDISQQRDRIVAVRDDHDRVRAMSRSTLRRLACEAGIRVAITREAEGDRSAATGGAVDGFAGRAPMDVGRRTRRPSATLRRAVHLRDRGCTYPGCGTTRNLHVHHVQHWADGGPTDLSNLVTLCGRHHRHVHGHEGELRIEVAADGRHRFTLAGRLLPASPAADDIGPPLPIPIGASAAALTPPGWDGGSVDLDLAVGAMQMRYARAATAA